MAALTTGLVGVASKLLLNMLTRCERDLTVQGSEHLEWLLNRPAYQAVITVSNHHSTMDDPLLWGLLPVRVMFQPHRMRWTLAAHDICYSSPLRARFFSYGQSLPTVSAARVTV
jgi:monolysocardiolipin acyltransferase